jgi:hypothetical protein
MQGWFSMGWNDRDYNPGREAMRGYMANPMAMLSFAWTIWRSSGLTITLTFWFLLAALFVVIGDLWNQMFAYLPIDLAVLLGVVLFHELGHRVFARMVGGNHWEWVLWPLGGMVPPAAPRTPWATFVANIGGIVFTVLLAAAAIVGIVLLQGQMALGRGGFIGVHGSVITPLALAFYHVAGNIIMQSIGIVLFNLYPCYWFDGGYIWQSILWPKLGQWKAVRVVCLAGMILAVPFFMLSLVTLNPFGMIMFALIFADCYRRRQALAMAGPGVMDEDEGPSYNYMDTPTSHSSGKKSLRRRWFGNSLRKKARAEQAEQAKIDAILAKVKEKGLHSLTWWEKRTLRKATERQRQQDLAERY